MLNRCLITSEYHSNKLERISKFVTRPNRKPSYHLFIVFAGKLRRLEDHGNIWVEDALDEAGKWTEPKLYKFRCWNICLNSKKLQYWLILHQLKSFITELNNTSDSLIRLSEKSVRVTSYSNYFINTSVSIFWARFSKLWFLGYWRVVPSIVGLFWAAVF